MPALANPVQENVTVSRFGPYRGGWQYYEGPGVGPYWIGDDAKQSAIDYAKARAKYAPAELRVLKQDGLIENVIGI